MMAQQHELKLNGGNILGTQKTIKIKGKMNINVFVYRLSFVSLRCFFLFTLRGIYVLVYNIFFN